MFGDYFGQRADYSSGLFYSCHRMYLNPDGSSSLDAPEEFKTRQTVRNLRKTEKQEQTTYEATGRRASQCPLQVKLMQLPGKSLEEHNRRFRQVANMVVGAVALEQGGEDRRARDAWIQKCEAGVKIWVNTRTGEVTTEYPLQENRSSTRSSINMSVNNSRRNSTSTLTSRRFSLQGKRSSEDYSHSPIRNRSPTKKSIMRTRSKSLDDLGGLNSPTDLGPGTASLIYDPEPVEELFLLLDQMQSKTTPKK
eukprot:gene5993-6441_t